ncbi:MAG: hypothetical protein ACFFDF_00325 [Candidatus Odinarchaeota archaeon]
MNSDKTNITDAAMRDLRDMTIELRTYTKYQKEQSDKLEILVNKLVDSNNNQEGRIQKLEIIAQGQDDLLKTHNKRIGELEETNKFNLMKFLKNQIPKVILIGLVTTIIFILFSYSKFLPEIQNMQHKINELEQKGDVTK